MIIKLILGVVGATFLVLGIFWCHWLALVAWIACACFYVLGGLVATDYWTTRKKDLDRG